MSSSTFRTHPPLTDVDLFFPLKPTGRIGEAMRELNRKQILADYAPPTCPKCRRPDCGLVEDVIVGLGAWVKALVECERARGNK